MRRMLQGSVLAVAALVALALAGCHPEDHDEIEHPVDVDEITGWSQSVYEWQTRTYQTICELADFADPTPGDGDYTEIGGQTDDYCGGDPEGGGTPDPPPDWGA